MAAIRKIKVRVTTSQFWKRGLIAEATAKRRMKARTGYLKSKKHIKIFKEIVATTEAEANSGLFQQVGDLFVFKPGDAESFLWERIRNMSDPDNYEVWSLPGIGLRAALNKMKVDYPKTMNAHPAGLLDLPARTGGTFETSAAEAFTLRPFENIIREKWIPNFVYQTQYGRDGLFANTKVAQAVATLYGLTVDIYAPSSSWYRAALPDVASDVMRSNQIDESAYQHWKQVLLSTAESSAEAGRAPNINWDIVERTIRDEAGPRTPDIMSRLHVELDPELARLVILAQTRKAEYEDNKRRRPRRSPARA